MTQLDIKPLSVAVEARANFLTEALIAKIAGIGFSLSYDELEEAHSLFVLECLRLAQRFSPRAGGLSLSSFLYARTENSVELYLRARKAGKRTILRESTSLTNDAGEDYLADSRRNDVLSASFQHDYVAMEHLLSTDEKVLLSALIEAEGNLCKAARAIGISEKKARLTRERIKGKFAELRDYRADF